MCQEPSPTDRFFKTMNDDELRAWYGEEHVMLAAERGAIGTLLISDRLFKYVHRLRHLGRFPTLFMFRHTDEEAFPDQTISHAARSLCSSLRMSRSSGRKS